MEGVSREGLGSASDELSAFRITSSIDIVVSAAFSLPLPLSLPDLDPKKLNPLKAGAAGLSLGVIGLCDEEGRVPITPTPGGGLAWLSGKDPSSWPRAVKAVVEPC